MSKLSLLDKLKAFFEVAITSYWSLLILAILIGLGVMFFLTNKHNAKRNKIIYIVFTIIMMIIVFISYNKPINKLFDYMMNNLFIAIYFPNLAIYFAAIIVTNIILWISIFSFKTSKLIKRLNIIIYTIINYLLVLILHLISSKKLDIFDQTVIYGNNKLTALIELSSIIFIIWVLFLIIYKIILIVLRKDYKPKVKKVLVKRVVKKLPENYNPVEIPTMVQGKLTNKLKTTSIKDKPYNKIKAPIMVQGEIPKKKIEEIPVKKKDYNKVETPLVVRGKAPKKKVKVEIKEVVKEKPTKAYEDMLSVEDYKLLLKLLLKEKEKETPKKIETKTEEKVVKQTTRIDDDFHEEANLTELENLYRSIR